MIEKKCLLSLISFAGLMLICFLSMHLMQLFNISYWIGVSIGGGIVLICLILFIATKGKNLILNIFIIIFNAASAGLSLSSLFVYLGEFPLIWHTAILFAILCLLFYIYCLLAKLKFFQQHYIISLLIYFMIILVANIIALCFSPLKIFILAILSLILLFSFLVSLVLFAKSTKKHIKNLTKCSFAVLIVVLIVLIILMEGDVDLDLAGAGGADSKNKKVNPYSFSW